MTRGDEQRAFRRRFVHVIRQHETPARPVATRTRRAPSHGHGFWGRQLTLYEEGSVRQPSIRDLARLVNRQRFQCDGASLNFDALERAPRAAGPAAPSSPSSSRTLASRSVAAAGGLHARPSKGCSRNPPDLRQKSKRRHRWGAASSASSGRCDDPRCSAPRRRHSVPRQPAQTDPGVVMGTLASYVATSVAIHARTRSRRRRTARSRPRQCGHASSTTQRADRWRGP